MTYEDTIKNLMDCIDYDNINHHQEENDILKHICFMSVDTLRDRLADKYLSLCHYNDFHELNLEKIVDTLNDVYDNLIEEMERGFHFKD